MKTFTELFHNLCEAIEGVNKNFTPHLSPIIIFMLVIDIFGFYSILREFFALLKFNEKHIESSDSHDDDPHYYGYIYLILSNVFYSAVQIIFKAWAASIGHTTTSEAEKTKVLLAKSMNRMSFGGNVAYTALLQCQTRNLKLQNQFFSINWNIVLTVSHSTDSFIFLNLIISDIHFLCV